MKKNTTMPSIEQMLEEMEQPTPDKVLIYLDPNIHSMVKEETEMLNKKSNRKISKSKVIQTMIELYLFGDDIEETNNKNKVTPKQAIAESFHLLSKYIQKELKQGNQDKQSQIDTVKKLQELLNKVKYD